MGWLFGRRRARIEREKRSEAIEMAIATIKLESTRDSDLASAEIRKLNKLVSTYGISGIWLEATANTRPKRKDQ